MRPVLLRSVRGRLARPASTRYNLVKTLTQSLTMWAIFFWLLPAVIYTFESRVGLGRYRFASRLWRVIAVAMFVLGWALAWTSAVYMVAHGDGTPLPADATRKLVVRGPYRYVRNPMGMGSFAQGIAVGLYLGSPLVTAYALAGTVGWDLLVRPWEEYDLEQRFGEPYARYREAVRCWVPRVRSYEGATV
jgi:protein-S-isoprenylcysteine O-methyltransferase Ste14